MVRRPMSRRIGRFAVVAMVAAAGAVAAAQQAEVAATLAFLEGPTVDREGNVYFVEMTTPRIMKMSAAGVLSTFREKSNNANGLVFDAEGRLIACEGAESNRNGVRTPANARITRTDMRTGAVEVLATSYQGMPLRGPNDVTLDRRGRIYFTDPGGAAVYRIDAPGVLARILSSSESSVRTASRSRRTTRFSTWPIRFRRPATRASFARSTWGRTGRRATVE